MGAFLKRAWKEAGPGALGWTGATDASMDEIASDDFLAALLARPGTHVVVAEETGEIIGIAVSRRIEGTVDELAGILLLESRTGRGVGRALLEAVLQRSRVGGAREILVRTEAANDRAVRFYQGLGFAPESRIEESVGGRQVELITLRRTLAQV